MFSNTIYFFDLFILFSLTFVIILRCIVYYFPRLGLFFNVNLNISNDAFFSIFYFFIVDLFIFCLLYSFDVYLEHIYFFSYLFLICFFLFHIIVVLLFINFNYSIKFDIWFIYKYWYRRFYRSFFKLLFYSRRYAIIFDKIFILYAHLNYILFPIHPYKQRSEATLFTVTIRWKNIIIFSLFDEDFRSLVDSFVQHFENRIYCFPNFVYFIEGKPYFISSLNEAINYEGCIALYELFDSLHVSDVIHKSHVEAYENNTKRELYSYDLDLSIYFPLLEHLKYFIFLLDWSSILVKDYYPSSSLYHIRLALINLVYNGYYNHFLYYIRSFLFFLIPFRHYYFLFVLSFFSLILHFGFILSSCNCMFAFLYLILISDFIYEMDCTNFFRHFFICSSFFFLGFFGFFFLFIEITHFFFNFFNKQWFYKPFECNYPFPHYLNQYR